MSRIRALEDRKADLVQEMESLLGESEERDFTEEETAAYDAREAELDGINARLEVENKLQAHRLSMEPAAVAEPVIGNPRLAVEEDPKRGFASLGEFGTLIYHGSRPGQQIDDRLRPMAAITGAGQAVGSAGGFLVPPEFSTAIWNGLAASDNNLLARCDQYTVSGESLTFNANAETSRATGSRWGGVRGYWIAEGNQLTSSAPTLRQVKLEPQQLAVLCYATDKLLNNATAVEQWLTRAAVEEIQFMVGDAIINGDGTGKPKGILGSGCKIEVSKETGQDADTVITENISKMWARCHAMARSNAVWFIDQSVEPELDNMTLNVGTSGVPTYLPPGGISELPYGRLKGRPVVPIEFCKVVGTAGDIILADLRAYAAGVRGGVDSAMSMHLRFDYLETAFRFVFEVDGRPWLASAITPFSAGDTLSPFVTLASRD